VETSEIPEPSDGEEQAPGPPPAPGRRRSRAGVYTRVFTLVALIVVLIALVVANAPRSVELSWVFGSGRASLVWVIVVSAILGWLVGIVTSAIIRHRTRPRP
jgi:uncharacterized integral membrane protein